MTPLVSIIIGSEDDMDIIQQAETVLNEYEVPYEITTIDPKQIETEIATVTKTAYEKGIRVIIAGTRGDYDFITQVAKSTAIPVVGVPMRSNNEDNSLEAVFSTLQQSFDTAIATVALDSGQNAGILAVQILATADEILLQKMIDFKENLKNKILKADKELGKEKFDFRTN